MTWVCRFTIAEAVFQCSGVILLYFEKGEWRGEHKGERSRWKRRERKEGKLDKSMERLKGRGMKT